MKKQFYSIISYGNQNKEMIINLEEISHFFVSDNCIVFVDSYKENGNQYVGLFKSKEDAEIEFSRLKKELCV